MRAAAGQRAGKMCAASVLQGGKALDLPLPRCCALTCAAACRAVGPWTVGIGMARYKLAMNTLSCVA